MNNRKGAVPYFGERTTVIDKPNIQVTNAGK